MSFQGSHLSLSLFPPSLPETVVHPDPHPLFPPSPCSLPGAIACTDPHPLHGTCWPHLQFMPPPAHYSGSSPGWVLASAMDMPSKFWVGIGASTHVYSRCCCVSTAQKWSCLLSWHGRNSPACLPGTTRWPETLESQIS